MSLHPAPRRRHLASSPFASSMHSTEQLPTFACDDRVSHDTHGLGRVVAVEEGTAVIVRFGVREVRITAPYRKLFKL